MTNVKLDCISCSNPCLASQPSAALKTYEGKAGNNNNESTNHAATKRTEAFFSRVVVYTLKKTLIPPPGFFDNMMAVRCPGAFKAATVPAISCRSPPGVNKKGPRATEY